MPYHCSFTSVKHMPGWKMWPHTIGCLLRQKTTGLLPCGVCLCRALYFIYFLYNTPHTQWEPIPFHLFTLTTFTSLFSSTQTPSFFLLIMPPGLQAQQAFRFEPKNLTVRMGATAELKCEVLRPSGTVQWMKDGLALGPERSLPGFPRYSMTGKLRGKQQRWQNVDLWTYLQ